MQTPILPLILLILLGLSFATFAQPNPEATPLPNHKRIGCICQDGSRSQATGKGACSNKGGVRYWLYADVSIYTQYSQNLPAIPSHKLVPLTPEQVKNFLKVIEKLPAIPDPTPEKKKKSPQDQDLDEQADENQNHKEDSPARRRKVKSEEDDCPCQDEKRSWQVMDFLLPFVLVLCIVLLFVIIFYVIKKIIQ